MSQSHVSISISEQVYLELARRYHKDIPSVIENILRNHLDSTELLGEDEPIDTRGISWSGRFLPYGTKLRTKYKGDYIIAEVKDQYIEWSDKRFTSVAQLANSMRGNTSNNAWRVLEIFLPGDSQWFLAQRLR